MVWTMQTSAGSESEVELAVGYAWDDNVGLDELERATGESDEVTSLEAQALRYLPSKIACR